MPFIHDDFLLSNNTARRLYHDHAAPMPIYDYHCHLPPRDLAGNRSFNDLYELWLEGDHYKWRAMRANGIDERYITGDAEPFEKFMAWAKTVPHTLRNPLHHWTHLELQRYFGIDALLNEDTAEGIWHDANRQIADHVDVRWVLDRFNVALIGTTDDPADDLGEHRALAESSLYETAIYPAFRPDRVYATADVGRWNGYIDRLGEAAGVTIDSLDALLDAVGKRHAYFHEHGSRLSDHGLAHLPDVECGEQQAAEIFGNARIGKPLSPIEQQQLMMYLMLKFGELDADAGWVKQLHLGAMRNTNQWAMANLGPDTGYDSIGDRPQAEGLKRYLGTLAGREKLPKTILYNLNPADNYVFATMIGNYQDGQTPGKVQLGSGWWFCDQLEAMRWQMDALSNLGLLSRFVGMLTDSRSFMSYPRHEYFRRLLCDLLGRDVESGLLPDDFDMLGALVEDICFNNAHNYFGMRLRGKFI